MEDQYEGKYPPANFDQDYRDALAKSNSIHNSNAPLTQLMETFESRKYFFLNCWQLNEYESDVMWRLYEHDSPPVVIQSTIGRMKQAIQGYETLVPWEKENVNIGKIAYRNPKQDPIPESNLFNLAFSKWVQFKHEDEVRAVVSSVPPVDHTEETDSNSEIDVPTVHLAWDQQRSGIRVSVDLDQLIQEIRASPDASDDEFGDIVSLCKSNGIDENKVNRSNITETRK